MVQHGNSFYLQKFSLAFFVLLLLLKRIDCKSRLIDIEECGTTDSLSRIIVLTDGGFWPWMASIGYFEDGDRWIHQCGATLISKNFVLTAAHCSRESSWNIRFGDQDHQDKSDDGSVVIRKMGKIHIHPNFKPEVAYFDIAVIEVDEVPFTDSIRPVCLPGTPSMEADQYDSDSVTLTGWGNKFKFGPPSAKLLQALLQIYDYDYCNQTHTAFAGELKSKVDLFLPQLFPLHLFCAGGIQGTGSCQGDSGGPLVKFYTKQRQYYQIAIVVGGIGECGDANFPGVYVRVDHPLVLNFINDVISGPADDSEGFAEIRRPACLTEDNHACIFPFKYGGQTYSSCIKTDSKAFWCATRTTSAGEIEDWGTCSDACPRHESQEPNPCPAFLTRQESLEEENLNCYDGVTPSTTATTRRTTGGRRISSGRRRTTTPRPNIRKISRTTATTTSRPIANRIITKNPTIRTTETPRQITRVTVTRPTSGPKEISRPIISIRTTTTTTTTTTPRPIANTLASRTRRPPSTTIAPRRTRRPVSLGYDETCYYECQKTGSCKVRFLTTKSAPGGSIQGFCFSKTFGGTCSGTPQLCQDCLGPCEGRAGEHFRLQANGNQEANENFRAEFLPEDDHCRYSCHENGGCSATIFSMSTISGSVRGSCFPESFGGACSGIPEACQPCLEICSANPTESEIVVKVDKTRQPKADPNSYTVDSCVVSCELNGACTVEVLNKSPRSGYLKGSCFPPSFGLGCTGIPEECEPCVEVCKDKSGEKLVLPVK